MITQINLRIQRTIAPKSPRIPPRRLRAGFAVRLAFALGFGLGFNVDFATPALAFLPYRFSATNGRLRLGGLVIFMGLPGYCFFHLTLSKANCLALDAAHRFIFVVANIFITFTPTK